MSAKISPQPLVVGEIDLNISASDIKKGMNPSFAAVSLPKQNQINLELFKVNFDHEVPKIVFTMEEVNSFSREEGLHQAVIVKFSYGRPELSEVRRTFSSLFDVKGHCIIGHLDYRHLLVRFDLFNDYVQFISKSIGFLKSKGDDYFFRTFPWTFGFNPKEETSMAVVWISLPGLPPNLFAKRSILSIASAVGKPLAIDKATQDRSRPSVARIKVILNLLDKLPEKITLQFIDSASGKTSEFHQQIVYDNLPEYCVLCKHQGHVDKVCRANKQTKISKEDKKCISSTEKIEKEAEIESLIANEKICIDENRLDKLEGDARVFLNNKRAAQREKEWREKKVIAGAHPDAHQKSDFVANSVIPNSNVASICKEIQIGAKQNIMESIGAKQSLKESVMQRDFESSEEKSTCIDSDTLSVPCDNMPFKEDTADQFCSNLKNRIVDNESTVVDVAGENHLCVDKALEGQVMQQMVVSTIDDSQIVELDVSAEEIGSNVHTVPLKNCSVDSENNRGQSIMELVTQRGYESNEVKSTGVDSLSTPCDKMPDIEASAVQICSNETTVPLNNIMFDSVKDMGIQSVVDVDRENQLFRDNAHNGHVIERGGQVLMGNEQQVVFNSEGENLEPTARTLFEMKSPTGNEQSSLVSDPEKPSIVPLLNEPLSLANAILDSQHEGLASRQLEGAAIIDKTAFVKSDSREAVSLLSQSTCVDIQQSQSQFSDIQRAVDEEDAANQISPSALVTAQTLQNKFPTVHNSFAALVYSNEENEHVSVIKDVRAKVNLEVVNRSSSNADLEAALKKQKEDEERYKMKGKAVAPYIPKKKNYFLRNNANLEPRQRERNWDREGVIIRTLPMRKAKQEQVDQKSKNLK